MEVITRAKAFSGRDVERIRCTVDTDGTVLVWDSVVGCYTPYHSLSESEQRRIRRLYELKKRPAQ